MNFWQQLHKPILALAPMAGVTDSPFRKLCRRLGADVVYSEMVSAAGLFYTDRDKTMRLLDFSAKERPYVVQLFGSDHKHFAYAARLVSHEVQPDGIDINFGCPVPKIAKQKAGAELMKNLGQSRRVVESVLENTELPVSLKVRARCGTVDAAAFMKNISDLPVSALMVHGRSLSQGFSGEADFSAVSMIKEFFPGIVLANGGIFTSEDGVQALKASGADGLGIARGAMGNPWLFARLKACLGSDDERQDQPLNKEFIDMIIEHAEEMFQVKGNQGIIEMRKHLCWYFKGMPNAAELRQKAVKVKTLDDIKKLICDLYIFNSR